MKALNANHATVWCAEFVDITHEPCPGSVAANDFLTASWKWFFKTFVLN